MKTGLCVLALCMFGISSFARAEGELVSTAQDQKGLSLTIYNKNLALVKDKRQINLPKGLSTLAFREVSAQIRPETALMHGRALAVLEQNFEYDLLTPASLLQKYVGREITMIKRHPTSGEDQPMQAKVLSAGDAGVVLQVGDRVETEVNGRLVYPDVPKNLRDRPTLTMQVASEEEGGRELELSYLSGGLNWQADYIAELNEKDEQLTFSGWVTITNESGVSYPAAKLQLVAGDVHVIEKKMQEEMGGAYRTMAAAPAEEQPMKEEAMFEYHLYSLDRPTNIGENQKKQISLLRAADVSCRKEFILQGADYYYRSQAGVLGEKMKVGVEIELKNERETGLGMPIPAGTVRVYKKDSAGFLQFIGEDSIDHTPEKEIMRLHLGEAFDITADKKQTNFKKVSGFSPYAYTFESSYEIKLKNAKQEPVQVKIVEPVPGDWEIVESSAPHTKETAHNASWRVDVPAKQSVTLTYTARVRF